MKKTAPFRREKRAAGAGAVVVALAGVATLISGSADAGQIDSATFFPLQTGMSESEILIRARSKREDMELRQVADELTDPGVGGSEFKIYRCLDEDGRVYYGDRPPGSPPNLVELN